MLIYLQVVEIFPTVNRAAAMGLATVCGNVANILSPHIVALVRYISSTSVHWGIS
jgi:hypothetical protein